MARLIVDELRRLFRTLVGVLADQPARLSSGFEISELYQTLLPYRSYRNVLQFDSAEDYEMAVLRLLAGQEGLAEVEPAEAREMLRLEAEAVHPDTGLFREFAGARVRLNERAVAEVLGESLRYAPPDSPLDRPAPTEEVEEVEEAEEAEETGGAGEAEEAEEAGEAGEKGEAEGVLTIGGVGEADERGAGEPAPPVFEPVDAPSTRPKCPDCHHELPRHRTVVFCPYCARQLVTARCRHCGDDVEPGWQYCVSCGHPVSG